MVGVQVRNEIRSDVLVGNFKCCEIGLRARAKIKYELVPITQFDQPRAIGLAAAYEWPASTEGDNAHLVNRKWLRVGKIIVTFACHDPLSRSPRKSRTHSWSGTAMVPSTKLPPVTATLFVEVGAAVRLSSVRCLSLGGQLLRICPDEGKWAK